jgi:hypothetical protein
MVDERKSSNAGKRAAEGLRQATAQEERKTESKMGMIELRAPIALKNALRVLMGKAQKISKKSNPAAASHQRLDTPEHLPAQASMISGGALRLVTSSSAGMRLPCLTPRAAIEI